MADKPRYDGPDKIAAIFLGTPALVGTILVILATSAPGTAPYEDRHTVIPVAISLLAVGLVGGTIYYRWRRKQQHQENLAKLESIGVFRLSSHQRNERMIAVSVAIAKEFSLAPKTLVIPASPKPITARDVFSEVKRVVQSLETDGAMPVIPASIRAVCGLISQFGNVPPQVLQMGTKLSRVIPMLRRRAFRRFFEKQTGIPAPVLITSPVVAGTIVTISLGLTFGILIPLAQWLDETHPIEHPSLFLKVAGKILGKGGFVLLFFVLVFVFGIVGRFLFPTFHEKFETIGQLAAYLRLEDSDAASLPREWTDELIWKEVRRIIANAMNCHENQIQLTTVIQ